MKYRSECNLVYFSFVISVLLTGCLAPLQQGKICPPAQSFNDVFSPLGTHSSAVIPFRTTGSCHLKYKTPDKKTNENFSIKIWFLPPDRIRLHGDIAFDPKGLDLGSNTDEFWLALRPKDFRSYYWGQWLQQSNDQFLLINPKTLVEAFGVTNLVDANLWVLEQDNAFDSLIKKDADGNIVKKLFVNRCTKYVEKIEYYQRTGRVVTAVNLQKYRNITADFAVPSKISITTCPDDKTVATFLFSLDSFKPQNFTQQQLDIIFTRPTTKGFEHVYKIIDDKTYEEY